MAVTDGYRNYREIAEGWSLAGKDRKECLVGNSDLSQFIKMPRFLNINFKRQILCCHFTSQWVCPNGSIAQNSVSPVSGVFSTVEINDEESSCSSKPDHLQSLLGTFVQEKGRAGSYDHMKHKS